MPGEDKTIDVNVESTQVVPFQVEDKPFSYLSDHFGISAELVTKNPLSTSFVFSDPLASSEVQNSSEWFMEKIDLIIGLVSLSVVLSLGCVAVFVSPNITGTPMASRPSFGS